MAIKEKGKRSVREIVVIQCYRLNCILIFIQSQKLTAHTLHRCGLSKNPMM